MAAVIAPGRSSIDHRSIASGTRMRFVLLIVLLVASSGSIMWEATADWFARAQDTFGCLLAAGGDPDQGDAPNDRAVAAHHQAYQACVDSHIPEPQWWVIIFWPAVLLVASVVLFRLLPVWKTRRSLVVPLSAVDGSGEIGHELMRLAQQAGLSGMPEMVVDLLSESTSAVVFGSTRHPVVRLPDGLLAARLKRPAAFQAVVLHEFAHIRNRDVSLTYVTVALWRVYVALVLVPFVVWSAVTAPSTTESPYWQGEAPSVIRQLILPAVMALLVYLARSDVLRSREIYADLEALRSGADPQGWTALDAERPTSRLKRWSGTFIELWRTHPRWDLRRRTHTDPVALFTERALPMFLTGTAASLIATQLTSYLGEGIAKTSWAGDSCTAVAAILIAGVAGVALWRSVLYAVLAERPVGPGLRTGLWLGFGMAFGSWLSGEVVSFLWLPEQPEFLLLPVLAGVVLAWWTTQCAHLWLRASRSRAARSLMILVVSCSAIALWAWLAWWRDYGSLTSNGSGFDPSGWRLVTEQEFSGPAASHQGTLFLISMVWPVLDWFNRPLVLAAILTMCIAPLAAWLVRPAPVASHPSCDPFQDTLELEPGVPPLRRVLLIAVSGGLVSSAGAAGAMAFMHTWQEPDGASAVYFLIYLSCVFAGLTAGMVVTALVANSIDRRYSLLVTLIATPISGLLGLAGWFVLAASDGCVPPVNTMSTRCGWHPDAGWLLVRSILGYVLLSAVGSAVSVSAAVAVAHKILRPEARRLRQTRHSQRLVARRFAVFLVFAALTGTAASDVVWHGQLDSTSGSPAKSIAALVAPPFGTASPQTRMRQVSFWYGYGGEAMVLRLSGDFDQLSAAVTRVRATADGKADRSTFQPICRAIAGDAQATDRYFPIPDLELEAKWSSFVTGAVTGGQNCDRAYEQSDNELFGTSMTQLSDALNAFGDTESGIKSILNSKTR